MDSNESSEYALSNEYFIYVLSQFLRWVNPLIMKGFNNELRMGDIYKWTFDSDATTLANELEGYVLKLEIHFSKMILLMVLTFK